ncbi:ras-related protein Rab-37-like isoform X2 [Gordionus sp. m RMFG-2023]
MLLGDSGVGKTCLLVRFKEGSFLGGNFMTTVGIDFRAKKNCRSHNLILVKYMSKTIEVENEKVKLQIWDTAGQERYRSITHAYYRDAHALLLLYDVSCKSSFDNIRAWLIEIKQYASPEVVLLLLANKSDVSSSFRKVNKDDGIRIAKENNVYFMEVSAKTGYNVQDAFLFVAKCLLNKSRDPTSHINMLPHLHNKSRKLSSHTNDSLTRKRKSSYTIYGQRLEKRRSKSRQKRGLGAKSPKIY